MKIAVMGAGAVGCYYGGLLARAGHEVTLVGRAAHVEAMRRDGLDLETQSLREKVRVAASTEPSAVRGAKVVLFSVKSGDTEAAGEAIAPHLDADAVLVTLQNGVDNPERLAARVRQPVVPAAVYVAVGMAGPGHVRHYGRGELLLGASAASEGLVALFRGAGVPAEVSGNVAGELWVKLVVNCAYNALSAITQLPYGELVRSEGVEAVMRDVVEECLSIAQASNVALPGDVRASVRDIARTMPGQRSSTAQDLARGKPTEIDHLNGLVVRKGEALGIAAPANRVLWTLVKALEKQGADERRGQRGWRAM